MWDTVYNKRKRIRSTLLLLVTVGVLFFYNWITEAVASAHVTPRVQWQDISRVVSRMQQKFLSEEEIALLCEQTGLGERTIMTLIRQGKVSELLKLQELYFAPVVIEEIRTTPLTISEWLAEEPIPGYKGMPMVDIRDGDILITKNSRFLGWRNGHAGLVVDAEEGLVLEAIMLGSPSQLCRISKWESYPSYMVLRLREEYTIQVNDEEEQAGTQNLTDDRADTPMHDLTVGEEANIPSDVASYASEHLVGVPYQLLAGVWKGESYVIETDEGIIGNTGVTTGVASEVGEVTAEALSGTQCAHLVWYAYNQFGIDLDSDGGLFVTPYDIQNSSYLEVVQVYGY